jgi:hypothetical protein
MRTDAMTSLSPGTWERIENEAPRFLHLPTRQIVDLLLLLTERQQIPPHVIERSVDPLRAELHRRETLGVEDPFDSPYPEVTWWAAHLLPLSPTSAPSGLRSPGSGFLLSNAARSVDAGILMAAVMAKRRTSALD